jgi:N-acetylglucosamine-6-phosphate deacetylase
VTPAGVVRGWIRIEGGRISDLAEGRAAGSGAHAHELDGRWVVPGFIDLHVHGGGGHSMLSADPAEIVAAAEFHRAHGTTRTLASIVSAPLDQTLEALRAVRDVVRAGPFPSAHVVGSHLEGPVLNPLRAGAHDRAHLLAPDRHVLDRLIEAADGTLRLITVAPELPGGTDLVRQAVAAGVVVALGHSDADHAQAQAAFDAGASHVTHLFNAMRPWHHREPGLAGAALTRPGVVSEIINDGIHLHDATAAVAFAAAGSGAISLVTDAIAPAGAADGEYRLGSAVVRVVDGAVRLADGQTLAGSVLTMDRAFRRAVQRLGVSHVDASIAASTTPARVLGLHESVGSLEPGRDADLVVLSDSLEVDGVMVGGEWIGSGRLFHT